MVPLAVLLTACNPDPVGPPHNDESLTLVALYPSSTQAGKPFNAQGNGNAAIGVSCIGSATSATLVFGVREFPTARDNKNCGFSAELPLDVISTPGTYDVYLRYDGRESNRKPFTITPAG